MSELSERSKRWIASFLDDYRELATEKAGSTYLDKLALRKYQRVLVVVSPLSHLFAVGFESSDAKEDVIEAWTTRLRMTESELVKTLSSEGFHRIYVLRLDSLLMEPSDYALHGFRMDIAKMDDSAALRIEDRAMIDMQARDHARRFYGAEAIKSVIDPTKVLPLLSYFSKKERESVEKTVRNCSIVLVQHLLGDFLSFAFALEMIGADPSKIFIVGIPYSTKDYVVHRLMSHGYNVFSPKAYPFDEYVKMVLSKVSPPFVIVEDGGYCVPLLYREFPHLANGCLGAVEQTKNGIDRDRKLKKFRRDVNIPIVNVAECESKKRIEGRLVADAIIRNLKVLLMRIGKGLTGKKVLVVGFGNVGESLADKLAQGQGVSVVMVHDTKETQLATAKAKGYVTDNHRPNLVSEADIIMGCTGGAHPCVSNPEITVLKNGAIIASASSKRREIDIDQMEYLSKNKETIDGVGTRYTLATESTVILLADGYPINFFDSESVPDEEIQFIPTLMFEGLVLLLKGKLRPCINPFPKNIEEEILKTYRMVLR